MELNGSIPPPVLNYLGFTEHDSLELPLDRIFDEKVIIKVDVTVQTLPFKPLYDPMYPTPEHLGTLSTDIMSKWLSIIPCLFRLCIFLKFFLHANTFNNTYQGNLEKKINI